MSSINPETVVSVLKDQIENYDQKTEVKEEGRIIQIADGIATVYGMDQAMYGELVIFETGVHGLVLNVERNCIGCVLLGSDHGLMEGSKVARTGVQADIPVGDAMIGRVVNAIGEPIDGKGEIKTDERRPIEHEAAGVIDRKSVDQPLQTGILAIDSMFPIGRGQRELIIGDRQTGKTSIAVDTILNQKGQDVICIYVAIGQKASTVSQIVTTLSKHGAMDYSIVVSASASDLASLQYIAPYAGTAIAEHFMHQGKDVLIVYDDLSKHAVAYRAISLLLDRPPGREAYPGDVFYLHSRLLERSCRLSDELGGGSIRIHQDDIQEKMFEALGFTKEDAYNRFGFLLDAFKFGVPPHAGLAYGLDRLVMWLTGEDSIRDVIAFPKVKDASCLMTQAPGPVDTLQLEELGIELSTPEEE